MSKPDVTFILLAFNEDKTIIHAIKSILNQKKFDGSISIIVVNDGSTDETATVVNRLTEKYENVTLINNKENKGRGFSRQIGVNNANSEYIAFVDGDIRLPTNWLDRCHEEIHQYDIVGGIAYPDGDVQYVFNTFNLNPKIVKHTVEVTGSNGLYKRSIFDNINFNEKMRDGEDVDFIWKIKRQGYKVKCIDDLLSLHKEAKDLTTSVRWMFESGRGATYLLLKHKNFRLPDLTFLVFLLVCFITAYTSFFISPITSILIPLYIISVSAVHLFTKFHLKLRLSHVLAILVNSLTITSYLLGRTYQSITSLIHTNE